MNNKLKILGILFFIVSSVFFIGTQLKQNSHLYVQKYNPSYYKHLFEASQWRVPNSKKPISDEQLYAYAGYEYVKGANPILINPEAPPLGKYIIGTSILLFNNEKIGSVLFGIITLIMLYFLVQLLTDSALLSSFAVFLTSFNTLFIDQLIHAPQLDIYQSFFFLLFLYLFIQYVKKKNITFLIHSGVALGLFSSIKVFVYQFSFLLFGIVLYYALLFFFTKKKARAFPFKDIFIVTGTALLVFSLTYFSYFLQEGSLRGLLGVQKWIFLFYRSSEIDTIRIIGSYIPLIFVNKWQFWSEGYPLISYKQWSFLWPVLFATSLLIVIDNIRKKRIDVITTFFITYNLFLFVTPIFPRYLLLLFLMTNCIICVFIANTFKNKIKLN